MGLVQIKFQNTVVDPVQEDNVQGDAIACRELMEKSANSFASVLRSSCTLEQSRKRIANATNDESNVPSRPAAPLGASLFSDIPWADTGDHQTRQKIRKRCSGDGASAPTTPMSQMSQPSPCSVASSPVSTMGSLLNVKQEQRQDARPQLRRLKSSENLGAHLEADGPPALPAAPAAATGAAAAPTKPKLSDKVAKIMQKASGLLKKAMDTFNDDAIWANKPRKRLVLVVVNLPHR